MGWASEYITCPSDRTEPKENPVMTQHNVDWTRHEVTIGVWDEDKCTGVLRIIPLGCEIGEHREIDGSCYSCYGIYVQVTIETEEFHYAICDFIHPSHFQSLLDMLKRNEQRCVGEVDMQGDDGNVEIHLKWRENGDLSVVGLIPSKCYPWENRLSRKPDLFRQFILPTVHFEFWVEPNKTLQTCDEIENLLSYIRSLDASYSE